jgi:hypothetical protein
LREDTTLEPTGRFPKRGLFMRAFLMVAIVAGFVVVFAVGFLSVVHDLLARFSQPLALMLESPEDNDHDSNKNPISSAWGANDARL